MEKTWILGGPTQMSLLWILQYLGKRIPASQASTTLYTALMFRERLTDYDCSIPEDVHDPFHPNLLWIRTHSQFSPCVKAEKNQSTWFEFRKLLNGFFTEYAMEISHSNGLFYTLNISFILEAKQNAIYIYIAPDKIWCKK